VQPVNDRRQAVRNEAGSAKIIALRRIAASGPSVAEELDRLANEVGGTLTELVATARAHGVELPRHVLRAAASLNSAKGRTLGEPSDRTEPGFEDVSDALDVDDAEPEDLAQALEACNIGFLTLNQLEATVASFGQGLPSASPAVVRRSIRDYYRRVVRLLGRTQPIAVRRQLCSVAAQLAGMMGSVEFDLYRPAKAGAYYDVALTAADQAGDPALSAWVLGKRSYLLVYEGDTVGALRAAEGASTFASRCTPTTEQAWLAVLEAELHATRGDAPSTQAALRRADHAMCKAQLQARRPGIDYFTPERLSAYKGSCYMLLGQAIPAQEHSREALSLLPSNAHSRSFVVLDLATTFVQQGEVDRACCSAGGLLNELTDAWTPRLARRVATFRQLLEPFGTARCVRDFDEQFPLPVSRRDGGVG
jgi:tetratricopeptide (TPR) repeat protein